MLIDYIKLNNFRIHKEYYLKIKPDTTLILGANGIGKTSVIEAIYLVLRGKSFKATDKEILNRESEFYRVELGKTDGEKIVATFDGNKKQFLIQDKKSARLPKKDKYPVILFLPEDMHLISTSPTKRRSYFDRILEEFDLNYHHNLLMYEKTLKQRNDLLKKIAISEQEFGLESESVFFSLNIMLSKYGTAINQTRQRYIGRINEKMTTLYRSIAQNEDEIEIHYDSLCGLSQNDYYKRLDAEFRIDLMRGVTKFGVHRDDFLFKFNGVLADGTASRGETRSIILALKFNEAELIETETRKKPVILLDDVFSELDKVRQTALVEKFKNHQVILTSVE